MEENNTNANVEVNTNENKPVEAEKGCCNCKWCGKSPVLKVVISILVIILVVYAITILVGKNGPKEMAPTENPNVGSGSVTIEVLPEQGGTVTETTGTSDAGVPEQTGRPVLE